MKRTHFKFCAFLLSALMLTAVPQIFCGSAVRAEESAEATELSVDPTGKGDGYSAVLYDNTSGLPTGEANAVLHTSDGFIWIGCYSGLVRYDGSSFERVDSTNGIASVVTLYEDSGHRLWVGTNDSGAAVMENGVFRLYGKAEGLDSLSVRSITEDDQGNICFGTTTGLSYVDPAGTLHKIDDPRINDAYIRRLRRTEDGTIWGVTVSGAVFTVRDLTISGFYDAETLGISDIHAVLPDPEHPGYAYIGNKGSMLYYGRFDDGFSVEQTYDIAPLDYINSLDFVGSMVWLCTDSGIGFIHDGQFTTVSNIPMTTSVENMVTDYQGNLWFASSKQGVMKIVPNQFTDIFQQYQLSKAVVESTCMYGDTLFVGTKSDGLLALRGDRVLRHYTLTGSFDASGNTYEDTDLLDMMKGRRIRSIFCDSQDRVWFSTFGELGLVCLDGTTVTRYTPKDGMPSDRIRTVSERSDGAIMVACTGGLVIIQDGRITRTYDAADGIDNTEILTVSETPGGDMIIGTDGGGIYVFDADGLTHFGTDNGLHSDVVMRVKPDVSRDLVWIVTSNSLACMTADRTVVTIQQFPYSNNFDLYENSNGEMWILSSNGIYVSDVDELLANGEIHPLFYGRDNGLPCISTSNSYSELTPDGDLYLAGTTGVAKVNIEKPFENVNDIMLSVPYLEADGQYYLPDASGRYVIPPSVRKLTVYSYVFNYSLMNPDVTYYLNGFDQPTTVKRSELTTASYTNLRGGDYEFVLQIKDPQGGSSKELRVPIVKQKALYEQLWLHILCIVFILGLIAVGVKLYIDNRTRRLKERENRAKQITREMVEAFAKVIDMKDSYTNGHSTRVAEYTVELCRELGMDEETIETYYCIALLHDIGKIGIPPEVLNKPGKLTDTEFNIIKSHSALGYQTLKDISIIPELAVGAGAHHERPDGKGYPKGLKGDEIPRVAQIIAVADTFDAMYSDRPYRKRMNFDKAVSIVKEVRGTQLAEDVVDAFLRLVEKGHFRLPDDDGGGTTEDIDNIHRRQKRESERSNTKEAENQNETSPDQPAGNAGNS